MSGKLERVFEVRVPVERAWEAFTDPHELEAWWAPEVSAFDARPGGDIAYSITGWGPHKGRILEFEPCRFLRWEEGPGHIPGTTEVAVTFEVTENGTRIHIVHSGFGDSGDWLGKAQAVTQGWGNCIADLILYLETGVRFNRMFTWRWTFGAGVEDTPAAPRIIAVRPGTYAERARLQVGDLVVQVGSAPIFGLSDLWLLCREHTAGEQLEVSVIRGGEIVRSSART